MEERIKSIRCSRCGRDLIILHINASYEQKELVYCKDCKDNFGDYKN